MSPFLHYEIACAHQQEIVRRATNAHRGRTARTTLDRRRSVKHRLIQVLVALGVCVASCTAVTVSDARSAQSPLKQHHARISAPQLARDIRALEAKGYVPTSCTVTGTLMHNYVTDQSVTINW